MNTTTVVDLIAAREAAASRCVHCRPRRPTREDVCLARGIGTEPKDTEGIRAKLKRLVNRQS
jgi:hypothetical protein